MKAFKVLLMLLALAALAFAVPATAAPASPAPALAAPALAQSSPPESVTLGGDYRITFNGVDYNGTNSTWAYTVEELPGAQDLGYWTLEIPACAEILNAKPKEWSAVSPDPNTGITGIKFQVGGGFESGSFEVSLKTTGQPGAVDVAAKGPDVSSGTIAGPTCGSAQPPAPTATQPPPQPTPTRQPTATQPPDGPPADTVPPAAAWVLPVANDQRYDVRPGETVLLQAAASDNAAVARVNFIRWDAPSGQYLPIAEDTSAPYQGYLYAGALNPAWNQVFAASTDGAGNQSPWVSIWLYRGDGSGGTAADLGNAIFLPYVRR